MPLFFLFILFSSSNHHLSSFFLISSEYEKTTNSGRLFFLVNFACALIGGARRNFFWLKQSNQRTWLEPFFYEDLAQKKSSWGFMLNFNPARIVFHDYNFLLKENVGFGTYKRIILP
jgi:hypothetical protein